ncbi:hypothetical protein MPLA_1190026 [Mesorhizobium sp. ORS 3359]|nr:hypothetical protein MPLA_1190026 [Mesorhizobium sp. ORS 3359]
MAQQTINTGATADDGTGDPIRDAFDKANDNFTELYTAIGALPEQIRDVIGAALVAGSNVTITVNDAGDTITIAASGGSSYTDEMARDAIGAALVAGSNVTITVNDGADTITIAATGASVSFASATEIRTGTEAAKAIAPDQLVASAAPQTLTDGATISWDMAAGFNAKVTITNNRTMAAPTNPKVGLSYALEVIQDGTGGRTMTWNAAFDWGSAGAPTLSTGAGKRDLVFLYCYDAAAPKFRAVFNKSA